MIESLHEDCGVFGIYGSDEAAQNTFLGLYALQHRGQESAGIVSTDGERMFEHKGMGLVAQVFDEHSIGQLEGRAAIGHNRYSTTGHPRVANIQPLLVDCRVGKLALAHNGNLVNARELRTQMEADGSIFNTTMDSEVIRHLIARSKEPSLDSMIADERSLFTASVDSRTGARPGGRVRLAIDPRAFHFFDPDTGLTLREREPTLTGAPA